MDGQKNQPTKPIDQPNEEFIEDQPNRRDQKSHSSDPLRRPSRDTADDSDSNASDRDDEDVDDMSEDIDGIDREEK